MNVVSCNDFIFNGEWVTSLSAWVRNLHPSSKQPVSYDVYPFPCASACLNTLRPRQNGRRFADDTFKRIFMNENVRISIKISLKFVPKGSIDNNPALVQIMAWRRSGGKPLFEPMMVSLLTHIFVTRPLWVKLKKCMHWWTGSILVQIRACRLIGAKPLSEATLTC